MPATRGQFPKGAISSLSKSDLIKACDHLNISNEGTVPILRQRLKDFASQRRNRHLRDDPTYAGLFVHLRNQRSPSPEEEEPNEPENGDDNENDYSDFGGIDEALQLFNEPADAGADEDQDNNVWDFDTSSTASSVNSRRRRSISPRVFGGRGPRPIDELESVDPEPQRSTSPEYQRPQREKSTQPPPPHKQPTSTRVAGTKLTSAAYQVPIKIRRIMKAGWIEHIPLTTLTDEYCAKEAEEGEDASEGTLHYRNGAFTSVQKSLPHKGEPQMSFDEWFQAWRRLLQLIKQFCPEDEYQMWLAHYLRIINNETRSECWTLWKSYDITIRRRSTIDKRFDPGEFHENIWKELSRRQDQQFIQTTIKSSLPGTSSNGKNQRHNPYSRSDEPDQGSANRNRDSFRQNQKGKLNQNYRCLICGSATHPPTNCFAATLINGKPLFLSKPTHNGSRR
ncbi:hypothetical protein CVT24_008132 [Panaeolus cyanescens]|uniref:SAP domain-containing protein n=1 Tax=Panaeolus cyanescens TaxID=181874 RepID=A0A409YLA3_9AGAR|nr:hypothetical protein CVT24_008132 [Panaeolus cyanescens]